MLGRKITTRGATRTQSRTSNIDIWHLSNLQWTGFKSHKKNSGEQNTNVPPNPWTKPFKNSNFEPYFS